MLNLNGKTVLITGASRGIGEAAAKTFAQAGANVMLTARNADKLKNIKKKLGDRTEYFAGDISDPNIVSQLVDFCYSHFGALDILINNAGVTNDALFLRMDLEKWTQVINTNLKSNFLLSSALSKNMIKKKWGRIINITSVVGHTGNFGQSNYSASKAGILGMSKSIALELAKRNVTVNCIAPGFIETSMTAVLSESQRESLIEKIPMGKIGSPKDVANCVEFLVSDKSEYVTGQTIHVNGGLAML